jgi:hypothetical protein
MTDDYTVKELSEWLRSVAKRKYRQPMEEDSKRLLDCADEIERLAAENERQNRICAKYSAEAELLWEQLAERDMVNVYLTDKLAAEQKALIKAEKELTLQVDTLIDLRSRIAELEQFKAWLDETHARKRQQTDQGG